MQKHLINRQVAFSSGPQRPCLPVPAVRERANAYQVRSKSSTASEIKTDSPSSSLDESQYVTEHKFELTPEERAATEQPLLEKAEASLSEYCSSLPGEGEESERCWLAYDYFEQRKGDAESGCTVDWSTKSRDGDCEKLNSFESFVRQLMGTTPMSSFAHLLFTLRKGELQASSSQDQEDEAKPEPQIVEVPAEDGGSHFELKNVPESGKERLVALFQAMDTNFDGRLNAAEFREAMEKLGMIQLSGPVVSTIFSAMDIHGSLTLQEFLYIIEAEEIVSDTPVTRWIRAHKGESSFWGELTNATM